MSFFFQLGPSGKEGQKSGSRLTATVDEREPSQVKLKSTPRLLKLTYAHLGKQAKDEKRLDGFQI
jgi:hypothetical protein